MKNISIAGNIGKDAATRQAGNGTVTSWTVAVEDRSSREKKTLWFDCNWWGTRGEKVAQYLTKGGKVAVSGEFSTREHDGKTYLTVNVSDVTLMGGKADGASSGGYDQTPEPKRNDGFGAGGRPSRDLDDEIPFAPEWRI